MRDLIPISTIWLRVNLGRLRQNENARWSVAPHEYTEDPPSQGAAAAEPDRCKHVYLRRGKK